MYDWLTARYTFSCPTGARAGVRLSSFRAVEQLPGPRRPAVYDVRFVCPCGDTHDALVTHDELDWAPLGAVAAAFYNVMTGRLEAATPSLVEEAAFKIKHGHWPWTFFCAAEHETRPAFPSTFRLLVPDRGRIGLAVCCPGCARTSVNFVSTDHLDIPFYSDARVEVAERVYRDEEGGLAALIDDLAAGVVDAHTRSLQ